MPIHGSAILYEVKNMALISWTSEFELNIEEIDRQHRLLVDIVNELYEAVRAGKENKVLEKLLNKLVHYTVFHFAREEHFFEVFGYPETEAHVREHDGFEKQVSDFIADFETGKKQLSMDILRFLSNWLVNHIKRRDRAYAEFMIARGLH